MVVTIFFISSTFIDNDDGGGGGVLSTAYLPLKFSGNSRFLQNRGRTLVVSINNHSIELCVCMVGNILNR